MTDTLISSLTVDALREFLHQAGYRAEVVADQPNLPVLRSATGGMPFDVRLNNRLAGDTAAYADMTLMAGLQVQGELALGVINDWNNARRFARLRLLQGHLILDMDVSVLGGVSPAHLRAKLELWDRLIHDLLAYLRELAAKNAAPEASVGTASQKDEQVAPAA